MVKIMENPMNKWDDLGGKPTIFGNIHILEGRDSHIGDSIPPPLEEGSEIHCNTPKIIQPAFFCVDFNGFQWQRLAAQ